MHQHRVSVVRTAALYPPAGEPASADVAEAFRQLGYDRERMDRPDWNPLGRLIKPGETVFIKPNMIAHKHQCDDSWEHVITHGSVIRAVVDFAFIALEGKGRIIIGDAPQTDSKWDLIVERMGLNAIRDFYRQEKRFEIELIDLRDEYWVEKDGVYVEKRKLPGDPLGGVAFDLGARSAFAELDGQGRKYYGAFYDVEETNRHHSAGKHEYRISKTPLAADVFISVPKLKTHKKCGITVNLKGLVGINADKNWLPHYAFGSPETGGDQFNRASVRGRIENTLVMKVKELLLTNNRLVQALARRGKQWAYRLFGRTDEVVRSGNWHGNETVWRMCIDLNRILMYGNPDGTWRASPKKYLSVVDGVVAMEGDGPVAGSPKAAGVILAGDNPVAVDAVCAKLMGFDVRKIPLIGRSFDRHDYPLIEEGGGIIHVASNHAAWNKPLNEFQINDVFHFKPHFGWTKHIEWTP